MHMKGRGQYLARSLSYEGASFRLVESELPPGFKVRKRDQTHSSIWAPAWLKPHNPTASNKQDGIKNRNEVDNKCSRGYCF
jgi:hypothetical protein